MAMEDATRIKYTSNGLVLRATSSGTEYPLQGEMLVGREVECAITLPSSHASRYHAKINVSANGVYIEDLHSTNGTYINGKKTRGRIRLSIGDEVTFDDVSFRFASLNSGSADATVLAPKRPVRATQAAKPQRSPVKAVPIRKSKEEEVAPVDEMDTKEQAWSPENIDTPKFEADDVNKTQMISPERMGQLVERNKNDSSINIGSGPRFIVMTAPLRGKLFQFDEALVGSRWQIGRGDASHILLNDKTISVDHALLNKTPQGFILSAVNAKNGVMINGIKQKQALLKHNDKIQIGRTELLFRSDEPSLDQLLETDEPYVELSNPRLSLISTLAVIAVIFIAVLITSK